MNILIFNTWATRRGGSQYSSLAFAQELHRRGNKVVFVSSGGDLVKEIEASGIKHYTLPIQRINPQLCHMSFRSVRRVAKIVRNENIDCIHAFQYFSYPVCYVVGAIYNRPVFYTCLGLLWKNNRLPRHHGTLIAVCEEFRDNLIENGAILSNIIIIRNRIDLQRYSSQGSLNKLPFRLSPESNGFRVVMMSRLDNGKMGAIRQVLDAMPLVSQRIPNVELIIAGDGTNYEAVSRIVEQINNKIGRKVVVLPGHVKAVSELLNQATLVLGIGRCAFEGMASRTPTLIVGEKGYAGTVCKEAIDTLAYYNFAGRNLVETVSCQRLAEIIIEILQDHNLAKRLGEYCYQYIVKEFDIIRGVDLLLAAYTREMDKKQNFILRIARVIEGCKIIAEQNLKHSWFKVLSRF